MFVREAEHIWKYQCSYRSLCVKTFQCMHSKCSNWSFIFHGTYFGISWILLVRVSIWLRGCLRHPPKYGTPRNKSSTYWYCHVNEIKLQYLFIFLHVVSGMQVLLRSCKGVFLISAAFASLFPALFGSLDRGSTRCTNSDDYWFRGEHTARTEEPQPWS